MPATEMKYYIFTSITHRIALIREKSITYTLLSFSLLALCFVFFIGCSKQESATEPSGPLDSFFSQSVEPGEIAYARLSADSSSLLIRTAESTILIDPAFLLPADVDAITKHGCDLLIYSHDHGDHYEKNTAVTLFQEMTPTVIVEPAMMPALQDAIDQDKLISAEAGTNIQVGNLTIVPMTGNHVGPTTVFGIQTDSVSLFFGADSGYTPLNGFKADIAFVPTGGASPTCSPEEAAKLIDDLNPHTVIPIHGEAHEDKTLKDMLAKDTPEKKVIISDVYETYSSEKQFYALSI